MTENKEKAIWIAAIVFLIFITGGTILLLLIPAIPFMFLRMAFPRLGKRREWVSLSQIRAEEEQALQQAARRRAIRNDLEILAHSQQQDLEAIQNKEGHGGY
jgi:hypothetical protein